MTFNGPVAASQQDGKERHWGSDLPILASGIMSSNLIGWKDGPTAFNKKSSPFISV